MNIRFLFPAVVLFGLIALIVKVQAADSNIEVIKACVILRNTPLTSIVRAQIARCLGWQSQTNSAMCTGFYQPITVAPLVEGEVQLAADKVSLYPEGRSELTGRVEVKQTNRIVSAETAHVYRNAINQQVTKIELLGEVRYVEPNKLMIARKATINTIDKSGEVEDVLYRFNAQRAAAILPSWGQAATIKRFADQNYQLLRATYSTCAPEDRAWHIKAQQIDLDNQNGSGTARNAQLLIGGVPVFYSPYLTFPISNERKSGFLFPTFGHTNIGGYDASFPYYVNLAPNYDATITPHPYSERGVMLGGQLRYLTSFTSGTLGASFLDNDKAYSKFLKFNQTQYPELQKNSTDRWSLNAINQTQLAPGLRFRLNYQQVSDDYYLQDFSSNLALLTERQLPREAELTYSSDNWLVSGLVQSYQTLQPINDIYQRLPQILAQGEYDDLIFDSQFALMAEMDNFQWPNSLAPMPNGPRYYFNPVWSVPVLKPWGYFTPSFEVIQNYYDLNHYYGFSNSGHAAFERTIPRASFDSGLYFDRQLHIFNKAFNQTLEPRLFYLYTPYRNQSEIPVFDSSYMIFNIDQLFRNNRYSGLDRIGDANQLAYALSSRWMSDEDGSEKAAFSIGQILYFADRKVKLCQSADGFCIDNPLVLGYLSPYSKLSPIASRASYHFNPFWSVTADYIWDSTRGTTNNAGLNFHYQPANNQLINIGYTYLVIGDITQLVQQVEIDPLHQLTFSAAWPINEKWSALGAYDYNISKGYEMLSLLGIQYDSCCWALRLLGGRSFQSLSPALHPQYNNNIYLQIQLKGLGSLGTSDPLSIIRTYLPGYIDSFHQS